MSTSRLSLLAAALLSGTACTDTPVSLPAAPASVGAPAPTPAAGSVRAQMLPTDPTDPPPGEQTPDEGFTRAPTRAAVEAAAQQAGAPQFDAALMDDVRREIDAEMAARRYQPSSLVEPTRDPGAPIGTSFQMDLKSAHQRLVQAYGNGLLLSCAFPPCMQRADVDGDGAIDMVLRVVEPKNLKAGLAFVLGNNTQQRVAAGQASALGDDLSWATGWKVTTVSASSTQSATSAILLSGTDDSGTKRAAQVYFGRDASGAPTGVKAAWVSPDTQAQ